MCYVTIDLLAAGIEQLYRWAITKVVVDSPSGSRCGLRVNIGCANAAAGALRAGGGYGDDSGITLADIYGSHAV
jgi:hypothetical protein